MIYFNDWNITEVEDKQQDEEFPLSSSSSLPPRFHVSPTARHGEKMRSSGLQQISCRTIWEFPGDLRPPNSRLSWKHLWQEENIQTILNMETYFFPLQLSVLDGCETNIFLCLQGGFGD